MQMNIFYSERILWYIYRIWSYLFWKKKAEFCHVKAKQSEFLGCDKPATNLELFKKAFTTKQPHIVHVIMSGNTYIIFIMPLWAYFFINFHAYLQKEKIRTYFIVLILIMESSTKSVSFNYFFKFVLKCCYI